MKEKVKLLKAIADFQQEAPVLLRDTDGYGYKDVVAEIYKEAEKNEDNEKPKENKLVTLNIDDGNWEKVMKFIVRNKSKGLRWIISTLETKYSIAQEVEKAIGSHVK